MGMIDTINKAREEGMAEILNRLAAEQRMINEQLAYQPKEQPMAPIDQQYKALVENYGKTPVDFGEIPRNPDVGPGLAAQLMKQGY